MRANTLKRRKTVHTIYTIIYYYNVSRVYGLLPNHNNGATRSFIVQHLRLKLKKKYIKNQNTGSDSELRSYTVGCVCSRMKMVINRDRDRRDVNIRCLSIIYKRNDITKSTSYLVNLAY